MHELPDYCRVASDIWVSRSPLVCFDVGEWHLPDRVCRQFGLRQVVPVAANTSPTLHGIDMRGRARTDWTQFHREHIDHWHHRREYLVVGVIDVAAMCYDDPYMVWYRRITRTLVGNPAHRPTSGYVEIGSTIEIATRYIAAIHDRIDRAIYAYDRPESLQDMYDARDMCSRSLHALREHERIGQPGVPEPPPTMPLGVPATSPAMPPAYPVHPPSSTSSSQQFTQYVSATQTSTFYVTPTMPSYTYHISSHDVPSSSRPSSSEIRPRRTTYRHITSPVTYDQSSSFLQVGDEEEFDRYVDPLLASGGQIEIPVSVEGVSQITQAESHQRLQPETQPEPEPEPQPQRLRTLTHVFSRRSRPNRDRRPPRCGTGGHV
ncbi:serine/threonine-protein phosphatase 7 long form homolog [Actinidia eriantha]|uniref:serine/threonine-protein phosphatase 7 long form homolog n=1 Tax=Actinidia eriantha TaxID=165200 RepID=UPI00258309AD|nr:serine/threonine-protein phosphatase 7 long form homolog [Actinidia eriantha]